MKVPARLIGLYENFLHNILGRPTVAQNGIGGLVNQVLVFMEKRFEIG